MDVTSANAGAQTEEALTGVGQGLPLARPPRNVPHVFNDHYTVDLTYCDRITRVTNPGGYFSYVFRATSIYDPDYTDTGHQPLGRDLWASMYDYYSVLKCEYEVEMYNCMDESLYYTATGTARQKIGAIVAGTNFSTNISDVDMAYPMVMGEMKNGQVHLIKPNDSHVFRGILSPKDFRLDAKDADNDRTWTAVGANPDVNRYFGFSVSNFLTGQPSGVEKTIYNQVQMMVKIRYTVQFAQVNATLRQYPS